MKVLLGVGVGIAAYKAAELARLLMQDGHEVQAVMTAAAGQFVQPLTFAALTGKKVLTDLFAIEEAIEHIAVAQEHEVLVIAPATADLMAKLAHGLAGDFLTTVYLAFTGKVVIAPAMNVNMWQHPATQANVRTLVERGAIQVGPVEGRLAEGITGMGRLAALEDVLAAIRVALGRPGPLDGRTIVVSAGGTHEPIDPVRFVGNRSSGKMGYAVAEAARDRGAKVILVSGPTALPAPWGIELQRVETAAQMGERLTAAVGGADAVIMAAAVADFRPESAADHKIKKRERDGLELRLAPNRDFSGDIAEAGGARLVKVYFAAETQNVVAYATDKLKRLRADLLVANDVTEPGSGFGTDTNRVTLLGKDGSREDLPLLSKDGVAARILDRVQQLLEPSG